MGTVPAPYFPTAGDDATQPRVATWVDAINFLLGNTTSAGSRRAEAVLRQTVAQSIPNAADTAINFDFEEADYDNGHSTVTNTSRYTAQTTGFYDVEYIVNFASNATGFRYAYLRVNGAGAVSSLITAVPVTGQVTSFSGSRRVFLTAGDYLELVVQQTSTAALNTGVTSLGATTMSIEWRSN